MKNTTRILLCGALAVGSLAMIQLSIAAPEGGRSAQVTHTYTLPPFSLVNFGYSQEELDVAQANGLSATDQPAIGSGLQRLDGNHYISITDRGPNADRADGNKAFPLPQFTPTIVLFTAVNDQIVPEAVLPIVNDLGEGVTGIPN